LTLADVELEDEVRELFRRAKICRGESYLQTAGAIAIAIASSQLVDGVDAHDCAASIPFGGNWNTRGASDMNLGLSSVISPRPSELRALGATKQSSRGFKPPYALSLSRQPAQYRSISSALLPIGAVCILAANRSENIGPPAVAQFFVCMEMHALDGIVGGRRCGQVEFVDEFAWGHWGAVGEARTRMWQLWLSGPPSRPCIAR
jgi:hypothetical protein